MMMMVICVMVICVMVMCDDDDDDDVYVLFNSCHTAAVDVRLREAWWKGLLIAPGCYCYPVLLPPLPQSFPVISQGDPLES